jgi:hypothetical protein
MQASAQIHYRESRGMSRYVLSNSDLTRQIIASASRPVEILQTSRSIREGLQPCSELYEQWHRSGCPSHPSGAEVACLNAIGGIHSQWCQGMFDVYAVADMKLTTNVGARSVASRIAQYLERPSRVAITIGAGPTVVKIQHEPQSTPTLTVLEDGWRRRGAPCTLPQAAALLEQLLTRTGAIDLPCPAGTSAPRSVNMTRRIVVTVTVAEHARNQVVLTATRK